MNRIGLHRVMILFLILLLAAGSALGGCAAQTTPPASQSPGQVSKAPPLKIGIAGPMAFVMGDHMWKGAEMAAEKINAAGGIKVGAQSRPIQLVKVDTNEVLNVPDASSAVERAITQDKIDFLLGGFRTEAVLGMQDVAADYKKIFIATGVGHPQLTQRVKDKYDTYKYFFRSNPMNSGDMAKATFLILNEVATVVREDLGIKKPKVAILAESAVWVEPLIAAAQKQFPGMGLDLAGVWRPSANATDVTAELTAIRGSGASIIFTIMSGPVGGIFARQYEELEIPAVATGINVDAQGGKFWKTTGGKGNYVSTMNIFGRAAITPKTVPFYDEFQKRYGEIPVYSAATYDAVFILAEAIEKAGGIDANELVPKLEQTDFSAITGRLVFTPQHDVTWGPGYVVGLGTQWLNGELKVFWPNGWQGLKYDGTVRLVIPPWVVKHWKK